MFIRNPLYILQGRLSGIAFLITLAVGVLLAQLINLQFFEKEKFVDSLRNQTTVSIVLPPARGSILDRNGIPLAENKASFDIDVYLTELVGHYAKSHKGGLPKVEVTVGQGDRKKVRKQIDVNRIVNESAQEVFKNLRVKRAYTEKEIYRQFNEKPNVPFALIRNLDFAALSQFSERNISIPGIQETARPTRQYPFGALAPQVLGYLGRIEEVTDAEYQPDYEGKNGIEDSLDEYLQGEPGNKILRKNSLGFILNEEGKQEPRAGNSVYLTLDARIQWIAEKAMRKVGRGAAVIVDVNNGDILAMVSVPNFDPNAFIPRIDAKTWTHLTRDPTHPLFNRAINAYAPGSIYKPLVALAALENKEMNPRFTPSTIIYSPGAVYLANRWWKDWSPNGQGAINLRRAIAMSCNTFFYQLGQRTGIDSIVRMGEKAGFAKKALNDDDDDDEILHGETPGVLPNPEWMEKDIKAKLDSWRKRVQKAKEKNLPLPPKPYVEKWSLGHTLNTSIGQGYVKVTPLQMSIFMASIANGGKVYYPRLVMGITTEENGQNKTVREFPTHLRSELGVEEKNLQAVREGLYAVVAEGTGRKGGINGWQVAGKTGTAQFFHNGAKDLRTWFNGYAPYDAPRFAITVMVEGGVSGGSSSAPIVSEIFQGIFDMEKQLQEGHNFEMSYLTPSIGHFNGVIYTEPSGGDASTSFSQEPSEQPSMQSHSRNRSFRNIRGLR